MFKSVKKSNDPRVLATKKLTEKALAELLETKNISEITVKELCQKAGISRGTFYLHYSIPKDVLDDIESDFTETTVPLYKKFLETYSEEDSEALFGYLFKDRNRAAIIFKFRDGNTFLMRMREIGRPLFVNSLKEIDKNIPDDYANAAYEYVFLGSNKMISSWLTDGAKYSVKSLTECMKVYSQAIIKATSEMEYRQ